MIKILHKFKELFTSKSYWYYSYCQNKNNQTCYGWGVQISYTPYFDAYNYHTWNKNCVPLRIDRITKKQYKLLLTLLKKNDK